MYDPYSDFTLYGGLIGYGQYWITRLRYQESTILARKCLSHITVLISERFSDISITEQTDVFCFYVIYRKYQVLMIVSGSWIYVRGNGICNRYL